MKNKIVISIMSVLMVALLASCNHVSVSGASAATVIEMEMTSSYDDSDPFINEKLIYVYDDADSADFEVSFQI